MKPRTLEENLIAMLAELTLPELRILRQRFDNDPEQISRIDAAIDQKLINILVDVSVRDLEALRGHPGTDPEELRRIDAAIAKKIERGER